MQNFTKLSIREQDKSNTVTFHVNKEKGTIVCRLYDRWYGIYHTGKAHCLDTDKWNEKKGRALAFNRARQKELEHNLKMIDEERNWLEEYYKEHMAKFDKRTQINTIYLEGVKEDLKELE